jgi:hypothetical protein
MEKKMVSQVVEEPMFGEKAFYVRFTDERAMFGASVIATDDWHARRVAEVYFHTTYGFDLSLCDWVEVEIEEED